MTGTTMDKQFGVELQKGTVATRVGLRTFYIQKALTDYQARKAAEPFNADRKYMSARKKLIDTNAKAWQRVTHLQYSAIQYWRAMTVPYPIKGIRLLNREAVEAFEEMMTKFTTELQAALADLDAEYPALREKAKQQLGELYSVADYPDSVSGQFAIDWDYPSVEPPEYLKQLNPALYAREVQRVQARFDEAVQMAEAAFAAELADLVALLAERLSPAEDGKKHVLRESVVVNLQEFVDRFKKLSIGSNAALDDVVGKVEQLIAGVDVKELRNSGEKRTQIKEGIATIKASIDALVVDQPERAFAFDET